MSKEQSPYSKVLKSKESVEAAKRLPKKPMELSDDDTKRLKLIAAKAKKMRIAKNMSYEFFALHAGINRNSYYRFEKSASTGDNYTVALLLKVIKGLDSTFEEFFKDIQ
jgi:DNA-binding XRE family transcriptional regulator